MDDELTPGKDVQDLQAERDELLKSMVELLKLQNEKIAAIESSAVVMTQWYFRLQAELSAVSTLLIQRGILSRQEIDQLASAFNQKMVEESLQQKSARSLGLLLLDESKVPKQ